MEDKINLIELTKTTTSEPRIEKIKNELVPFLSKIILDRYAKQKASEASVSVEVRSFENMDWRKMLEENGMDFGKCITNEKTIEKNWDEISPDKVVALSFPEFRPALGEEKSHINNFVQYLHEKYPDRNKYEFPGIEYFMYLLKNPDKVPENMKDGEAHVFAGAIFARENGVWALPWVKWNPDGGYLFQGAVWLKHQWKIGSSIVALEKE